MSIKFGTDGWRAVIARDFTFANIRVLSQAIADYLKTTHKKKNFKVAVGYDCRFLSKEFAQEVCGVLSANKIKVILSSEAIPTPLLSLATKNYKADLGIMITASHNPYYFNGLKIKTSQGGAADRDITDKVEKLLFKNKPLFISLYEAEEKGFLQIKDFSSDYIRFLKSYVDTSLIKKRKLKLLVDLMYGSGNSFLEKVLEGGRVSFRYLRKEFNPSFGGSQPEPVEENLKELIGEMKKGEFDLGIVLDGDADRIACVLKGGRFINAQVILPLLALHLAKNKKFSGGIVKTVVGSNLIDSVSLSLGRILYETPVGFKYISKLFQTEDILVGGEEAGGIGFKNYIPERDGTMAGLLLLEMVAQEGRNLEELVKDLEKSLGRWFYLRKAIPLKKVKKSVLDKIKIPDRLLGEGVERVNRLDGIKIITPSFWLMFRASGTEPILRIYAEAKSKKKVCQLLSQGERMINAL
ncbi:MAG TPA: phosphoglucomutase/phosphomannomutase family protein [Candidatus Omnitrophica bacterium]|nr:MAG: phosphoglucomutase/phosphomannomutase family protein [Candidatus Omnitrophota bacterium]RKY43353.1 MAG: phosphoglucomutase/phosphomannomutase family protein [Candidatus Omnitrophota bacterium]HEC68877.1 phosphoglucomutase/phosphomannomutase family protein [Candidatus Omnitrophota bacterium]